MFYLHEQLARGEQAMRTLAGFRVCVCGAGALGANVLEGLARSGFRSLRVIDMDRVEERNLSTQPYHRADVGRPKAKTLANALFRAVGIEVEARSEELASANARCLLGGVRLVVDTFDNSAARQAVKDACEADGLACLHAGLASGYSEVIWNESYRVPSASNDDVCEYPLARNLAVLTSAVVCEVVTAFALTDEKRSFTVTLADLTIAPYR